MAAVAAKSSPFARARASAPEPVRGRPRSAAAAIVGAGALIIVAVLAVYFASGNIRQQISITRPRVEVTSKSSRPVAPAPPRTGSPTNGQSRTDDGAAVEIDDSPDEQEGGDAATCTLTASEALAVLRHSLHAHESTDAAGGRDAVREDVRAELERMLEALTEAPASQRARQLEAAHVGTPSETQTHAYVHTHAHVRTTYDALIDKTFNEYAALHYSLMHTSPDARMASGVAVPTSARPRYVCWSVRDYTGAGWGNRMIGFIAALALAMATDRAMLMCDDGLLGATIAPVGVEHGGIAWSGRGAAQDVFHAREPGQTWTERHVGLGMGMNDEMCCDNLRESWGSTVMISIESTQYFFPCLSHNPHLRDWFLQHLGPGLTFFRHAMQRFVRLHDNLRGSFDNFVRDTLKPAWYTQLQNGGVYSPGKKRYVIGLQIRTGHLIRQEHEEQVFYKCAKSIGSQVLVQPPVLRDVWGTPASANAPSASVPSPAPPASPAPPTAQLPQSVPESRAVSALDHALSALARFLDLDDVELPVRPGARRLAVDTAAAGSTADDAMRDAEHGPQRSEPAVDYGSEDLSAADAIFGGARAARARLLRQYARARSLEADPGPDELEVVYFLATDSNDVRQRAASALGPALITFSGPSGVEGAALDNLLLSACDDVIVTWPRSTFGLIGASLTFSGRAPYVVNSGSKRSNECVRQVSLEPCFHGWFMRYKTRCYTRAGFETPEMLNQDNCYFCIDDFACPAGDSADAFLHPVSPLAYDAIHEVSDGDRDRFLTPTGSSIAGIKGQFRDAYEAWKREHPNA